MFANCGGACRVEFPGTTFYFLPADIVTQILNFGLPAPIDVQIEGDDVVASHRIAVHMMDQMRSIPGLEDLRVQEPLDYPTLDVNVNRTLAEQGGYTENNVATSVLNSLSGSGQVTPMFFLNFNNDVNYSIIAQTPQYRIQSIQDLRNIPITGAGKAASTEILGDLASIRRSDEMATVSQYNTRRVIDIYGSPQDRDLGAISRDVNRVVEENEKSLPRGTYITVRGQVQTMHNSYRELLTGIAFAIALVYMLIVVNFQSWLDPFIIITALPAALAGIVLFLFFTHTTLSVPALMGAIMCMGVGTANSILVVSFAKERLHASRRCGSGRYRGRRHASSPGSDDSPRHDHGHDPDGSWNGRRRRAERSAWPCGDRRPVVRHGRDSGFRSSGFCIASWQTFPGRRGVAHSGRRSQGACVETVIESLLESLLQGD